MSQLSEADALFTARPEAMERTSPAYGRLRDRALALPVAQARDFASGEVPSGADPGEFRVIDNSALRSRLILAGIAESVQSTKGCQRRASIIRIRNEAFHRFEADAPRQPAALAPRHFQRGRSLNCASGIDTTRLMW